MTPAQAYRTALEAAAKLAQSYEPRCDTCPSGVAAAIRVLPVPAFEELVGAQLFAESVEEEKTKLRKEESMTTDQIKHMVTRFLAWKLPAAIRALPMPQDAGDMVMLPREPTAAMINAANDSMWEAAEPLNPAGIEFALWTQIYHAMTKAAGGKP